MPCRAPSVGHIIRPSVKVSSFLPTSRYLVFLSFHYPRILLQVTAAQMAFFFFSKLSYH